MKEPTVLIFLKWKLYTVTMKYIGHFKFKLSFKDTYITFLKYMMNFFTQKLSYLIRIYYD